MPRPMDDRAPAEVLEDIKREPNGLVMHRWSQVCCHMVRHHQVVSTMVFGTNGRMTIVVALPPDCRD